jgi:hypothetical protein
MVVYGMSVAITGENNNEDCQTPQMAMSMLAPQLLAP